MNTITFSGKLIADARINKGEKGNFISFTLFETGKGNDAQKLDCTQNIKGDVPPSIFDYLKKFTTVLVTGTPYARTGKNKEGHSIPVLSCFVDKIEIISFHEEKKAE
jgi:hypothetical protein